MTFLAHFASIIAFGMAALLLIRARAPYGFMLWFPKVLAGALAPVGITVGVLGTGLGVAIAAPLAIGIGATGALILVCYMWQIITTPADFNATFGAGWQQKIASRQQSGLLRRRWGVGLPRTREPRWQRDLSFWMIPGTDRQLLCDLWKPPEGIQPSGLAFIYFHGSAWYLFDKDLFTRPFFRHLTVQGHVVMDVSYRLFPEANVFEMVGDVKRSIAWMKAHAGQFGVDPLRIVLGGGSAGGHISMLAAYAPDHPSLTPEDVQGMDLSVRAVVSCYGPADLVDCYHHTGQARLAGSKPVDVRQMTRSQLMVNSGRLDLLLGGHPTEIPEVYALLSPVSHVHPGCPPTLLIQGKQDWVSPVKSIHTLHRRLVEAGVPAVNILFPHTNHAFDLFFPQISPPAQAALYYTDRFLALMAGENWSLTSRLASATQVAAGT